MAHFFSQFVSVAPRFTNISGNLNIVANGNNKLRLTCNTDSSNPPSTITWYINENVTSFTEEISQSVGDYGGRITTNVLELVPTRDMDGFIVKCMANNVMSVNNVTSNVTLNLRCK